MGGIQDTSDRGWKWKLYQPRHNRPEHPGTARRQPEIPVRSICLQTKFSLCLRLLSAATFGFCCVLCFTTEVLCVFKPARYPILAERPVMRRI